MIRFYKLFLLNASFYTVLFCLISNLAFAENVKLNVFVSILPQKYFAERLLGENGTVDVLIGAGQSPHTYEPLPKQMGKLSRADMFFAVGVPFEKSLVKKLENLCLNLVIVNTDQGIKKRIMAEGGCRHNHDDEHESHEKGNCHNSGEKDPHFWLDPLLALSMTENMAKAIVERKPELEKNVKGNLEAIKLEIAALVEDLSKTLAQAKGQTMLVFHPAFGYFADKFGLIQKSVEIEGKEPAPKQLGELIKACRREGIKIIFVQKQFSAFTAKTIADSIEGRVIAIDPLAENYIENMKNMAKAVTGGTD